MTNSTISNNDITKLKGRVSIKRHENNSNVSLRDLNIIIYYIRTGRTAIVLNTYEFNKSKILC